jgi:hypothetical protein
MEAAMLCERTTIRSCQSSKLKTPGAIARRAPPSPASSASSGSAIHRPNGAGKRNPYSMFDHEWLGDEHDTLDVLRAQSSERTFQFLAHPSLDDLSPQAQVANRYLGLLEYSRRVGVSGISHHTDDLAR